MTKAYQQELEKLQRLKRELIKKHPELAGFEEREIPEFLRLKLTLAEMRQRIAQSTTEFSKVIAHYFNANKDSHAVMSKKKLARDSFLNNLTTQQRADMAAEAELDVPSFLREKLTLAEVKGQIAKSDTEFSKTINLE